MNAPDLLYQWQEQIDKVFSDWGRWQKVGLARWITGILQAESCTLSAVARAVSGGRQVESQERRIQRWLANDGIEMTEAMRAWVGWVGQQWGQAAMLLVVDETRLSDQVAVMMVSVYYQQSAIPLLWRAYRPDAYPEDGQVALLTALLAQLRAALPAHLPLLLLADRGLGTSPAWQDRLTALGYPYLLRVQQSTRVRLADGKAQPLRRLVGYGQRWTGRAQVFKKAGWRWLHVYLYWEVGYAQPWCLVSNQADLSPSLYAYRFAHEASFRDLKSDGFDWQRSRVWQPAHLDRLLLPLTLALFWVLTTGTLVWQLYPLTARQKRLSHFRLGLDEIYARFHATKPTALEFYLVPDSPILKSVVT